MKRDPLPAHVLATRIIPNVAPDMAKELGLTPDQKSLAIVTADSDDVTYTGLLGGLVQGAVGHVVAVGGNDTNGAVLLG